MLTRHVKPQTHFAITLTLCLKPHFSRSIRHAHNLFDEMPQRTAPSINNAMLTYIHQNSSHKALNIFKSCLQCRDHVDGDVVVIALKACRGDPVTGGQIHGFVVSSGFLGYQMVLNSLTNMYVKSGRLDRAIEVFFGMDEADIVSYNTILSGLENTVDVLSFASRMNVNGVVFDPVTYSTVLWFCSDGEGFLFGCQLHSIILKSGLAGEVFIGNALISMYSKHGYVEEAEGHGVMERDSISL